MASSHFSMGNRSAKKFNSRQKNNRKFMFGCLIFIVDVSIVSVAYIIKKLEAA